MEHTYSKVSKTNSRNFKKRNDVNNFCKTRTLKQDNELNRHDSIRSQCRITGNIRR
jgi:hypothetical protein